MITGIRVFDSILDSDNANTVDRNAADFWKPFCKSAGWGFNYERVHSLADLEYFFSKSIKENVIIFSGHGNQNGFYLSNGEIFDGTNFTKGISVKNHGKIIIFSSCLMGKNIDLCHRLKNFFKADYLFTYQHLMCDRFCFLYESILLTTMEHKTQAKNSFTDNDFFNFKMQTDFMKNMNQKGVKNHPFLMFYK